MTNITFKHRLSTYIGYIILGLAFGLWAMLVPFVKDRLMVDKAQLGMLLLLIATGAVISMFFTGLTAAKIGCRKTVVISTILVIICLPVLSVSSNIYLTGLFMLLFGMGLGMLDVTLNIQGAPSDYNYYSLYTNNLKLKPGTNYNIILEVKEKRGVGTLSVVSQKIDGETQIEGQFNGSFSNAFGNLGPGIYTKKLKTLNKEELENTVAGLRTFISLDKGNYSSMTFRISVIEDTTVTSDTFIYEPYQETNYLIDLQGNEMVALPNGVKDESTIDKESNINLVKNIDKVILNGVDDFWWADDGNNGFFTNRLQDKCASQYLLNDHFTCSNSYDTWTGVGKFGIGLSGNLWFMPTNQSMTLEDWIAWLKENNLTTYYQTKEPQIISLGKLENLITTENGSNTFAINGNIDTNISTTYALDLKKYIDNKISTVSQAVIEQE